MGFLHLPVAFTALLCLSAAVARDGPPRHQPGSLQQAALIDTAGKSKVVTSPALQGDIKIGNLLHRARQLSNIANLSIDEYNHPTRVISSKGA